MELVPYFLAALITFNPSPNTNSDGAIDPGRVVEEAPNNPEATCQDPRVQALVNLLSQHNSPLLPYAEDFVKSANKYGVDWRLLPAISGVESSFGKRLVADSYNAYGWGQGYVYFSNWEEGIEKVNQALKEKYIDRGAETVNKIGPIYAEDPNWSTKVNSFVNKLNDELAALSSSEVSTESD